MPEDNKLLDAWDLYDILGESNLEPGTGAYSTLDFVLLVDTKDGDPPRHVASAEWDYEHKALILSVD